MKVDKRNIESFIRVRRDLGWTDQQIAAQLGSVGTTTIATWRNKFKIRPANKFRPHFTGRYGPDALERFQSMVEKGATLQEIGDYFGFSRENARLVKKKLHR